MGMEPTTNADVGVDNKDCTRNDPFVSFPGDLEIDEVLEEKEFEYSQRSAIIFLIDIRKGMFDKKSDGSYFFKTCIQCYRDVLLNLARKQHKNYATGIVVFGNEKSAGPTLPKNVLELQEMGISSAKRIKHTDDMMMENFNKIIKEYGQSDTFSLASAIHYCQVLLKKWKQKVYRKGIILFTNDDNPFANDRIEAHKARKQVQELGLLNVELDIVPFGEFVMDLFYKELILMAKDVPLEEWSQQEAEISTQTIMEQVDNFVSKMSSHFRKLRLGKTRDILVTMYRFYKEPKRIMKTTKNKNQDSISMPSTSGGGQNDSGANEGNEKKSLFSKSDLITRCVGGREITITRAEKNWRKLKTGIGFTLIGFTHTDSVPEFYSIDNPYFVLPYQKDVSGAQLYACLYKSCLSKGVGMLCWYMFHKNAKPSLVLLSPISVPVSSDGQTVEGFVCVKLPFLDNLIELDEDEKIIGWEPSEGQREAARELVKKLTFRYGVNSFHDQNHRNFIAMIEALALGYDEPEKFDDDTVVDKEAMDERIGDLKEAFEDCGEEEEEETEKKEVKKKRGEGGEEVSRKKIKVEGPLDIIHIIKEKKAESLNMKQLKEILKMEGVRSVSNMNKPDLIRVAYSIFCREEYD